MSWDFVEVMEREPRGSSECWKGGKEGWAYKDETRKGCEHSWNTSRLCLAESCMQISWVLLVTQSCPTLCDPIYCSPPVSFFRGILQARILEWVAIPFSRASAPPKDQTWVLCTTDSLPSEPPKQKFSVLGLFSFQNSIYQSRLVLWCIIFISMMWSKRQSKGFFCQLYLNISSTKYPQTYRIMFPLWQTFCQIGDFVQMHLFL